MEPVELRVSITVADFERLRAFYRDRVGLTETQSWEFHGRGVVFDVGRATLELIDEEHAAFVDEVEVGRPAATGGLRLGGALGRAGPAPRRPAGGGRGRRRPGRSGDRRRRWRAARRRTRDAVG